MNAISTTTRADVAASMIDDVLRNAAASPEKIITIIIAICIKELNQTILPIWNVSAGEDILPSPPLEYANTLIWYALPGERLRM